MGYQIVSVTLKDGRRFDQVVALDGYFTQVRGHPVMPFTSKDEIGRAAVTHKRWNFREE
jgi:hypothetical protein